MQNLVVPVLILWLHIELLGHQVGGLCVNLKHEGGRVGEKFRREMVVKKE